VACPAYFYTIFYTIFLPIISQTGRLKKNTENEICVLILFTTFVWNISHSKSSAGYDQKCIFLSDFNGTWIFHQILEKYTNIKFHENPSRRSRGVPCRWTDGRTEGRTDRKKLIVAFRTLATEPKCFRSRLPKWSATAYSVSTHAFITHQYPHEEQAPHWRVISSTNNVLSLMHVHITKPGSHT